MQEKNAPKRKIFAVGQLYFPSYALWRTAPSRPAASASHVGFFYGVRCPGTAFPTGPYKQNIRFSHSLARHQLSSSAGAVPGRRISTSASCLPLVIPTNSAGTQPLASPLTRAFPPAQTPVLPVLNCLVPHSYLFFSRGIHPHETSSGRFAVPRRLGRLRRVCSASFRAAPDYRGRPVWRARGARPTDQP